LPGGCSPSTGELELCPAAVNVSSQSVAVEPLLEKLYWVDMKASVTAKVSPFPCDV